MGSKKPQSIPPGMERPAGLPTSPPQPMVEWWNPPAVQPQINSHLDNHKRNLQGLMNWLRMEEKRSESLGCEASMKGDIESERYFDGRQEMALRAQQWIEHYTRGIK